MVTINCPRSSIRNVQILSTYEKVKSVSIIPHHELYNFQNSLFKFLFPESKQKTEWTNKIFKYKYSNLPPRFKFNSNKSSLFHSTREKQAKHLYPFVYRKGSRALLSSIFRREQDLVISARVSSFNDARGWWNCQKSFELRYPSSWNSSRAARGSRLKPENQARYLRNEKGSCGPATPFALK